MATRKIVYPKDFRRANLNDWLIMGDSAMRARQVGLLCAAGLMMAACLSKAVVTDISDSAVKIQTNNSTPEAEIDSRARAACATYGKAAVRMGQTCFDIYCIRREVVFACN
jgi:hypothetical protein